MVRYPFCKRLYWGNVSKLFSQGNYNMSCGWDRTRNRPLCHAAPKQSAFRPERSTTDVTWIDGWLAAQALKEENTKKIFGIDMSAAFDTINRCFSLRNSRNNCHWRWTTTNTVPYGWHSHWHKNKRYYNIKTIHNVGTSQGDSLSPVLFTVYLEYALYKVQLKLPRTTSSFEAEIPNEVAYTDSVDFIRKNYADIKEIQFQDHLLKVNTDKTEYTS